MNNKEFYDNVYERGHASNYGGGGDGMSVRRTMGLNITKGFLDLTGLLDL